MIESPAATAVAGAAPPATFEGRPLRVMQVMAGAREGGAETFFVTLVLALARAGLDQHVIMRPNLGRAAALRAGGLAPIELPFGRWTDFTTVPMLKRQAAVYRPDIVLTWMSRASALFPAGDFLRLARLGGYYKIKNYRRCDHLICNTRDIVRHVEAQGWPATRVHYVPNFARADDVPAIDRARLDTPAGAPLVLALGRLHAAKAYDVLLRALALEKRAFLWLAGEGALRGELEGLARSLGLAERVRFLGWRTDRAALFAAADVCVVPSRVEPFGNVVVEAWAHRCPVVAAASVGPANLIADRADGLLVPVDDPAALAEALARVIDDGDLARRLVEAGARRHAAEFTEEACTARYLDLFRRLLAARAGARAAPS